MTTARWMAFATLTVAIWQAPLPAWAEVYKCKVAGRTVYQDQPCTEAGAEPAKTTGAASGNAPPSSDLATLHRQMQEAHEQSAQVRAAYERDLQETKAKAGAMTLDQQRQFTKVLHARWDPKLQAAGRREQELSDWLRKICPGGALNAQAQCAK
ncbi:DUF4124 domain-containing protein [Lysobacter tyrosinilyticus]